MTLKQRARKITEALQEHAIIKAEDADVVMKVVYSNMLYVRNTAVQEIRFILDEHIAKNYTETVKATISEIRRKVDNL